MTHLVRRAAYLLALTIWLIAHHAVPTAAQALAYPAPIAPVEVPRVVSRGPWSGSLRLAHIFTETPTIKTFRLVDPAGCPIPFSFLPGQFLTLTIAQDAKTVKRSYTIASSPTQRDYVELTIKREELGSVSRHLHDQVREGDLLQVSTPQDYFTFTGAEADSIVLIGGGVGLTPLMSVIRYLTDRGWRQDIYLLYCCRSTEDFVFREELEHLQRRYPTLHVVATMTRAAGTTWMGPTGRLTKELLAQTVPDLPSRRIHLCGPAAMMDAVRAILLDFSTHERGSAAVPGWPAMVNPGDLSAKHQLLAATCEAWNDIRGVGWYKHH